MREEILSIEPWLGVLTGPVVFLFNVQISFSVMPWVCATGNLWAAQVAAVASLVLTTISGWLAYRTWRRVDDYEPTHYGGELSRSRFLGFIGVLTAAFFALAIMSLWVPPLLRGGCS